MSNFTSPTEVHIDADGDSYIPPPATGAANTSVDTDPMDAAYRTDYVRSHWWSYSPAATGDVTVKVLFAHHSPVNNDRAATVYSVTGGTLTRVSSLVTYDTDTFEAWTAGATMLIQGMMMDAIDDMQIAVTGPHSADFPPLVMVDPHNTSVVEGQTATFTSLAWGSPVPTVQWQTKRGGF